MFAALCTIGLGFLARQAAPLPGGMAPGRAVADFLRAGGWAAIPLWGGGLGALWALRWSGRARERVAALLLALLLTAFSLVPHPIPETLQERFGEPRSPLAKSRAILRWSYRSPATVAQILGLSRDHDPRVREQAVLALGINLIVTDIEHATSGRPARLASHPLRDSLRLRLLEALRDPVEGVRVEAARALWKAPITFGPQAAAAETLAAVLDRATSPRAVERFTWLALDAAAGTPDSALKAASARFAAATADSELARVAHQAAAWP